MKTKFSADFIAAVKAQNRSEALYDAIKAKNDDTKLVVKAVEDGADLNRPYEDRLPLEWAIHFGKFNRFKVLCEIQPKVGKVANLNAIIPIGDKKIEMSLLHYATVKGLADFVRYLVVDRQLDPTLQDKHTRKLLPIHHAAASGNIATLAVLNDQNQALTARSGAGDYCIHVAIMRGQIAMVEHLLALGADLSCQNDEGRTPLHCAITWQQTAMVDFLLTKNIPSDQCDFQGRNAYLLAVGMRDVRLVEKLIRLGYSYEFCDADGMSAMHIAAENNDVSMLRFLNGIKGLSVFGSDKKGRRPIHIAAELGNIAILEALYKIPGVNFQIADDDGLLPLHYAAGAGKQAALEWLCQHNGGALVSQDSHGRDCLFHAARGDQSELILDLVTVKKMSLTTLCAKKLTVMHHAVFKSAKKSVLALKNLKMSIDVRDDNGMTPFLLACRSGLVNMLDFLIEQGAKKDACNNTGRNAWYFAAGGCHDIELFKCLERLDIPLNELKPSQSNPIHIAAMGANIVGLKYFISRGFCHCAVNTAGETPLMKAQSARAKIETELLAKRNLQRLAECQQLEAKIADFQAVENYLIALDAPLAEEVGSKRDRQEPIPSSDDTRVVKPRVASNEAEEAAYVTAIPAGRD